MASNPITDRRPASSPKNSGPHDQQRGPALSLRQGSDDFRDLRGDLIFAGLIYT